MWGVWELLRPIVVLLFVYSSGLLLVQWALSEASRLTRISVAAGVSPILFGWLLIIESLLGIDITIFSIVGGLLALDLALAGMVIWRNPQGFRRPLYRIRVTLRRWQERLKNRTLAERQTSLSNLAMFAIAIVIVPLASTYMTRVTKEGFTEFSIVEQEPDVSLWRRAVPLDESISVSVAVKSTERRAADFSVRVMTFDEEVERIDLGTLAPGAEVTESIDLPSRTDEVQRFELALLKDGEVDAPEPESYRTVFFWVSTAVERR